MSNPETLIGIYHTLFTVFLVLAVVFLAISVILFFKFNIRNIFDMRTGRGKRRRIKKMEEENAQTGRLRNRTGAPNTDGFTGEALPASATLSPSGITAEKNHEGVNKPQEQVSGSAVTEVLQEAREGSAETELLQEKEAGVAKTKPPQMATEKAVTENNTLRSKEAAEETKEKRKLPGAFTVHKELMWVHTEEVL